MRLAFLRELKEREIKTLSIVDILYARLVGGDCLTQCRQQRIMARNPILLYYYQAGDFVKNISKKQTINYVSRYAFLLKVKSSHLQNMYYCRHVKS